MSGIQKGNLLYEGKGKKVFEVKDHLDQVVLFFKDDLTAYQALKKGSFEDKGVICKKISSMIFSYLKKEGIDTHFLKDLSDRESLCLKTKILPLEAVVRNRIAGSTAKRLGFKEGSLIDEPLMEFYYKKDELDDPFISEEQILGLKLIEEVEYLPKIKELSLLINEKLKVFFDKASLELIDFKLEFGIYENKLLLADEISPDSCRIWDKKTGYPFDKDRFRKDLGGVEKAYKEVLKRLEEASK